MILKRLDKTSDTSEKLSVRHLSDICPTPVRHLSGGAFQRATISRSELVAVVQEVHRLEGWSGGGDSEEEVQRIGEAVAEDPRGAAGMARFYLSILEELRHQEEGDEIVERRRVG